MMRSRVMRRMCCSCSQRYMYRSLQTEGYIQLYARPYSYSSSQQTLRSLPWQRYSLHRLPSMQQTLICVASLHNAAFTKKHLQVSQFKQHNLPGGFSIFPVVQSITLLQLVRAQSNIPDTEGAQDIIYIPSPVEWTYEYLEYFHDEVCLSWWMAIIAMTLVYKSLLCFPFAVLQQRVFARIENAQPQINTFVEQTKQQLALIAKEKNWSKAEHQTQFDKEVKYIVRDIHMRERCGPLRLTYVFFAQMGVWVTVSMALGQMTGWYPELFHAEPDIDVLMSLSTGGSLWFTDLMQSDFVIPVMVGLVNLALVELWSLRRGPLTRMQNRFHNLARFLAIGSMPVAVMMPSAISFYWLVSSLFNLGQFALLRNLWARRYLGISQSPSEMKHPLAEIKTALKIKYHGKKVF